MKLIKEGDSILIANDNQMIKQILIEAKKNGTNFSIFLLKNRNHCQKSFIKEITDHQIYV